MNRFVRGDQNDSKSEILLDILPYRRPRTFPVLKKLWMRIRIFLKEAIPWLMLGILPINYLYYPGVIDLIGDVSSPVIVALFGIPKETVLALVVRFLWKDLAVRRMTPLGRGGGSAWIFLMCVSHWCGFRDTIVQVSETF